MVLMPNYEYDRNREMALAKGKVRREQNEMEDNEIQADEAQAIFAAGRLQGRREVVECAESIIPLIKEGMYGELWQDQLKDWGLA